MDVFIRFLFDFMSQFFSGIIQIFSNIGSGIAKMVDINAYSKIIKGYEGDMKGADWIFVGLVILVFVILIGLMVFAVFLMIRKYIRFRKTLVEQEELLEEVADLNKSVLKLTQEKEKILAMKVSQLGLKAGDVVLDETLEETTDTEKNPANKSRFYNLTEIDRKYENYEPVDFKNKFDLEELVKTFRNYAASKMKLYYKEEIIRLFISSLASTRLVILQGISGTGKTSLPYAWGKFIKNDAIIASVQPSWRDRTELFGYFNEFTKRFNETEVLSKMYEANYRDIVYLTILDEMNIARVEYYFAEMLSILEMPSRDEWVIDLVPNVWPDDPKKLTDGKLKIPENMWYIGTINNDDSTFMVTDKVYDRAMPIDINDKGEAFDAPLTDSLEISSKYLESLFVQAKEAHPVSEEILKKLEEMDNYVIEHFRLAFGNRIVKHVREFIPVYIACGGKEIDGLDYVIAKKILRKFEQLNLSFIRDEIDSFIKYLDGLFGKENMKECKDYLNRLKKLM